MTTNEQLSTWLNQLSKEIKHGKPADTLATGLTGVFCALSMMARQDRQLDVQEIVGALEMAKAHTVHEWHEAITRSSVGDRD